MISESVEKAPWITTGSGSRVSNLFFASTSPPNVMPTYQDSIFQLTVLEITDMRNSVQRSTETQHSILAYFNACSAAASNYVQFPSDYAGLPVLIGQDNKPVYLYELVEAVDEAVDYDEVKRMLPTLSFAQISGAIAFLRRVAQFNLRGVDIDGLELRFFRDSVEIANELQAAVSDKEPSRVLNFSDSIGG